MKPLTIEVDIAKYIGKDKRFKRKSDVDLWVISRLRPGASGHEKEMTYVYPSEMLDEVVFNFKPLQIKRESCGTYNLINPVNEL